MNDSSSTSKPKREVVVPNAPDDRVDRQSTFENAVSKSLNRLSISFWLSLDGWKNSPGSSSSSAKCSVEVPKCVSWTFPQAIGGVKVADPDSFGRECQCHVTACVEDSEEEQKLERVTWTSRVELVEGIINSSQQTYYFAGHIRHDSGDYFYLLVQLQAEKCFNRDRSKINWLTYFCEKSKDEVVVLISRNRLEVLFIDVGADNKNFITIFVSDTQCSDKTLPSSG